MSANGMEQQMKEWITSVHSVAAQQVSFYEGRVLIPGVTKESVDYIRNEWEIPENSVIIASYPKTGTIWSIEIVRQILCGRNEELQAVTKSIPSPMFLLEMGTTKKFDILKNIQLPRKYFTTHLDERLFNFDKVKKSKSKIIYVYRNPKDQAVSWFHFTNKIVAEDKKKELMLGKDWNEFFVKYTNGEHATGLCKGEWYPDHLTSWMKHKDDENFFAVEYESLKKNFPKELRKIAKFLEVDVSDEEVDRITEKCTLSSMKKAAEHETSGFLKMNVRKGEVGGWKDTFTVAQSERMDQLIEEKVTPTGLKFTYVL